MDVFISGAAGRAVFVKGTEAYFINLDRPMERISIGDDRLIGAAVFRALSDSSDVRQLSCETEKEGLLALLTESNKDSALRIFEIAIDCSDDPELAIDAICELERLISDDETYSFLYNYVFSIPYGLPLDKKNLPSRMQDFPRSFSLIDQVISAQPEVSRMREAWTKTIEGRFATLQEAVAIEKIFMESGAFKLLTDLLIEKAKLDSIIFELHVALQRVADHREIISSLLAELGVNTETVKTKASFDLQAVAKADEVFDQPEEKSSSLSGKAEYVKFESVNDQKNTIIQRLKAGDVANAQRFTQDLINDQVNADDAEFAAKTLCSLAQVAKNLGYRSLRLEWALKATKVFSDDPWPFAQAGDAYISLYRYDEAIEYFNLAGEKGDDFYCRVGKARISMLTGRSVEDFGSSVQGDREDIS